MVYGWDDYISQKDENNHHAKKFVIFALIIVFAVCFFIFNVAVVHPWIDSDVTIDSHGEKSIITMVFTNTGTMEDRSLMLNINSGGISCEAQVPGNCFSSSMETSCEKLNVGEKIIYRCFLEAPSTEIRVIMKSRYQIIRDIYRCTATKCTKDNSPVYGSSPIFWNYVLFYPLDRMLRDVQ